MGSTWRYRASVWRYLRAMDTTTTCGLTAASTQAPPNAPSAPRKRSAPRMPTRALKRRRRLYTQEELCVVLGCSRRTLQRLEREPFPPLLVSYLKAIGMVWSFYPERKRSRRAVEE